MYSQFMMHGQKNIKLFPYKFNLIQLAYFTNIYDCTVFQNCEMNDISVVPTSKVSTALTLIMLDRLNITITKLTNVGQSVHETGVYNKIME